MNSKHRISKAMCIFVVVYCILACCARCSSSEDTDVCARGEDVRTCAARGIAKRLRTIETTEEEMESLLRQIIRADAAREFLNMNDYHTNSVEDFGTKRRKLPACKQQGYSGCNTWNKQCCSGLYCDSSAVCSPSPCASASLPSNTQARSSTAWIAGTDPTCKANGETSKGPCVFPFTWRGVTYNACTEADSSGEPWCGTEGWAQDNNNWGYCDSMCDIVPTCSASGGTFAVTDTNPCSFECATGYQGDPGYLTCNEDNSAVTVSQTTPCTPHWQCAAFNPGSNIISTSVGGCTITNGEITGLHQGDSCLVKCADGYVGSSTTASIVCSATSDGDSAAYAAANAEFSCAQIRCAAVDTASFYNTEQHTVSGGAGCIAALRLGAGSPSDCTLTCGNGYTGSVSGALSCPIDAIEGQEPSLDVTPQCSEISCAPFIFGAGTADATVGMESAGDSPCTNRQILTTVTSSRCTVGCKTGYVATGSGEVTCGPRSSATPNMDPTVDLTCEEARCLPLALNETLGVVGGGVSNSLNWGTVTSCYDGITLTSIDEKFCSVKCKEGFSRAQDSEATTELAAVAYYKCRSANVQHDRNAVLCDVSESGGCPQSADPFSCVEHACAPFYFADVDAGVRNFVESDAASGSGCIDGTTLTTHSNSQCRLRCKDDETSQSIVVSCPRYASPGDPLVFGSIRCTGQKCPPLSFGTGVEGDESSSKACTLGTALYENDHCAVACVAGYSSVDEEAAARIDCSENGTLTSDFACVENSCAPFHFESGVVGSGTVRPCYNNVVLTTQTHTTCEIGCDVGFERSDSSGSSIVSCPAASDPGGSTVSSLQCTEILCGALELPFGTEGTTTTSVSACVAGVMLSADPLSIEHSCIVRCMEGFTPVSDSELVVLTCSEDASAGDKPSGLDTIVCIENHCAPLTFPRGAAPAFERALGLADGSLGCDEGEELSSRGRSVCGLTCAAGYSEVTETGVSSCTSLKNETACVAEGDRCVFDEESGRCATAVRCAANASMGDPVSHFELQCDLILTRVEMRCATPGCARGEESTSDRRKDRQLSASFADDTLASTCSRTSGLDVASIVAESSALSVSTEGGDAIDIEGFLRSSVACTEDSAETELFLLVGSDDDAIGADSLVPTSSLSPHACSIIDSSNGDAIVRCTMPPGAGANRELRLMRGRGMCEVGAGNQDAGSVRYEDTSLLQSCRFSYSAPIVSDVEGCDGCSRDGGDVLTIRGLNFGRSGGLIFVNGDECGNVTHGSDSSVLTSSESCREEEDSDCHHVMKCVVPGLRSWQSSSNTLLVIQSNLFASSSSGIVYETCAPGTKQVETSNDCVPCEPGSFSGDDGDAFECSSCGVGTFTASTGASVCNSCDAGSVADGLGFTACVRCPGGKRANADRDSCESCGIWYLGESAGSNCETPVFAICFAVFGFIALVAIGYFVTIRCLSMRKKIEFQKALVSSRDHEIQMMTDAWKISWDQIEIVRELARGGGGVVYYGKLSGTEVAVKTIMQTSKIDLASQQEVRWMQRARHPRLLLFFGCGRAPDNNIFVAVEFMNGGDLLHLLESSRVSNKPTPWSERMQYCVDVAEAMTYIHLELNSIHRDLKSENVLLAMENGVLRAKVADFGLSRIVGGPQLGASPSLASVSSRRSSTFWSKNRRSGSNASRHASSFFMASPHVTGQGEIKDRSLSACQGDETVDFSVVDVVTSRADVLVQHQANHMTAGQGTIAYMAPELLTKEALRSENAAYSQSVDTFAFGVIMWEVSELARAWGSEKWSNRIIDTTLAGGRLPLTKTFVPPFEAPPRGYVELLKICWSQRPRDRPTFDKVLDGLLSIVKLGDLDAVVQQKQHRQRANRENEWASKTEVVKSDRSGRSKGAPDALPPPLPPKKILELRTMRGPSKATEDELPSPHISL